MRTLPIGILALLTIGLILISTLRPASAENDEPVEQAACLKPSESFDGKTIEQWRSEGPGELAELIGKMQPSIEQYRSDHFGLTATTHPDLAQEIEANIRLLDQVAQQRDAYAAGLYWHTDLDAAVKEAKRTNRPILSLRMLGNLVDEYSCANSRFFRTVLYANKTVGDLMREKFVLHWQSVRPVPVITIDMGDGRVIKRTITGNSAHYVLDMNGRVVEAIPGLYGAKTFERLASEACALAEAVGEMDDKNFTETVRLVHGLLGAESDKVWAEIAKPADKPASERAKAIEALARQQEAPVARRASTRSPAKHAVEFRLLNAVLPDVPSPQDVAGDAELWNRVAAHYADQSKLDSGSGQLFAMKANGSPGAEQAAARAFGKGRVEMPLLRMMRNFENAIALDTARNEHLLHREIHNWFIEAKAPLDLTTLNKRVYAELFLTPDEDPWLGLVPADTYTGLDQGGLTQ